MPAGIAEVAAGTAWPAWPAAWSPATGVGADDEFTREALSHVDSLFGTALRLTRRPADADDLVQDTYLKAFRASAQFQRGTNLKAWLFTILHNTFRNMRRHDGRNPIDIDSEAVEQSANLSVHDETPEQILTRATLDGDLQAALDALPVAFRLAVWLHGLESRRNIDGGNCVGHDGLLVTMKSS